MHKIKSPSFSRLLDQKTLVRTMKSKSYMKVAEDLGDACWEGYEAVGTKKKNGKEVPNCVPKGKKRKHHSRFFLL